MNYQNIAENLLCADFSVLPLNIDKSPNLPKGHNLLYEPTDDLTLFKDTALIGIACGDVSGNLMCMDFDAHSGQNIKEKFKLFADCDEFRNLVNKKLVAISQTPSNGYHIYARFDEPIGGGAVLARWEDREVMIEIRGRGQYAACHPSTGYKMLKGADIVDLKPLPMHIFDWFVERAKSLNILFDERAHTSNDSRNWTGHWNKATPDGRFNEEGAEEIKQLLSLQGWTYVNTSQGVEYWRRPNKDIGISATFGYKRNMFYVFSSSTNLKEHTAYTPFNLLVKLKYKGDWKRAKDDLAERYNIPKFQPKLSTVILDDEDIQLDNFPIDVFPEQLQYIINQMSNALQFKRDITACGIMYTTATLIGNSMKLKVKTGWNAPPIFWFCALGLPGTNKSHPINLLVSPLDKLDQKSQLDYLRKEAEYEANGSKGPKPTFIQRQIKDFTLESLHYVHNFNPRGLGLHKDELVGFLNDMNKYRQGSDEEFWLESFNNANYTVNRVNKSPTILTNVCVNIIGGIQPDVLAGVLANKKNNGLFDRFLYTATEEDFSTIPEQDLDEGVLTFWTDLVNHWDRSLYYKAEGDTQIIEMNTEAYKKFREFDKEMVEMQKNETNKIRSYIAKIKTYMPRFILLMYFLDTQFKSINGVPASSYADVNHVASAIKLCNYFLKTGRKVLQEQTKLQEINNVMLSAKGATRQEQIQILLKKGFKGKEIANKLQVSEAYISKIKAIFCKKL